MKLKLSVLTVVASLSMLTSAAFAGGGPHDPIEPKCKPGTPVVTPPHTAYETLVQIMTTVRNDAGGFTTLDIFARFDGRETRKEGPGCDNQIIELGTPSLHLLYSKFGKNYETVEQNDYVTDGQGITVEPIWENGGRVIGAKYFNVARQELLNVVCKPDYASGNTGNNVPGKANGVINGLVLNNADVNCRTIAWVTTLPR